MCNAVYQLVLCECTTWCPPNDEVCQHGISQNITLCSAADYYMYSHTSIFPCIIYLSSQSILVPLIYVPTIMTISHSLDYYCFVIILWPGSVTLLNLFLFFKSCFGYSWSFPLHMNFIITCQFLLKILLGFGLELQWIHRWNKQNWHVNSIESLEPEQSTSLHLHRSSLISLTAIL